MAIALFLALGCNCEPGATRPGSDVMVEAHRIVLMEPDSAPLTRIQAVAAAPDGSLLVLDGAVADASGYVYVSDAAPELRLR